MKKELHLCTMNNCLCLPVTILSLVSSIYMNIKSFRVLSEIASRFRRVTWGWLIPLNIFCHSLFLCTYNFSKPLTCIINFTYDNERDMLETFLKRLLNTINHNWMLHLNVMLQIIRIYTYTSSKLLYHA